MSAGERDAIDDAMAGIHDPAFKGTGAMVPLENHTISVSKHGGFVILTIGGKSHRVTKTDARKLGGLLQKAGL